MSRDVSGRLTAGSSAGSSPSRAGKGASKSAGEGTGVGQDRRRGQEAVDEMAERAKELMIFRFIRLESVDVEFHFVSEDDASQRPLFSLADVSGLRIKLHPVIVRSRRCSAQDLLLDLRNTVIMDILSQAGQNFKNIGAYLAPRLGLGSSATDGFAAAANLQ